MGGCQRAGRVTGGPKVRELVPYTSFTPFCAQRPLVHKSGMKWPLACGKKQKKKTCLSTVRHCHFAVVRSFDHNRLLRESKLVEQVESAVEVRV